MINEILKPKSRKDVIEALRNEKVPSYRLSSFLKLIDVGSARKLEVWCKTVFKKDPQDMEVKQVGDSFYGRCFGNCVGHGSGFASNANYKVMRWNNYYIYPRGDFGKLIIKFMDQNYLKKMMK